MSGRSTEPTYVMENILAHPVLRFVGDAQGGPALPGTCQRSRSIHRLWCLRAQVKVAQAQRCLIFAVCWGTLILDPWCRCSLVALPVSACPCLSLCCHHLPTALLNSDMHF